MTCIVGIIDGDKAYVGGDSASTSAYHVVMRKDPKVFEKEGFVFGCTSSYRMIQLLRYSLKIPEIGAKELMEYMCTDFISSIRQCFQENGYLQKASEGDDRGGRFIVAYQNRLFQIDTDFQVMESSCPYLSVGSGSEVAIGALYANAKYGIESLTSLLDALQAAAYHSEGVRPPFIVLNT